MEGLASLQPGLPPAVRVHGGRAAARRLAANGVTHLFTLSGGHLFPIYDGCREEGIALVDVRHEQTAAFAAEGWGKVTRDVGACAVTAGPGVTNTVSAIAAAQAHRSPLVVIGGRAPDFRWGQGSLQEFDHVPVVAPLTRSAETVHAPEAIAGAIDDAFAAARRAPSGPAFVDIPIDVQWNEADCPSAEPRAPEPAAAAPTGDVDRLAALLAAAERPVVLAGSGVWQARAEQALRQFVERCALPTLANGLARGCLPPGHDLLVTCARSEALANADVVVLVGTPIDFRLAFGDAFASDARVALLDSAPYDRPLPPQVGVQLYGDIAATLDALSAATPPGNTGPARTSGWLVRLQSSHAAGRARNAALMDDDRAPLHPARVYRALGEVLDPDAIVVGDGGDFVSFAGRLVDTHQPGCFLDPGPFGCLGSGPGYALAAALAHPGRQVCLLLGDGAFGFAGLEFDTFVRHGIPVVAVVGNNGIWALEKHPMEMLFGYSLAADLQPALRYDRVVEALGGHGEHVEQPQELVPALTRAFASGRPALVNVACDPSVAYPRSTNLA